MWKGAHGGISAYLLCYWTPRPQIIHLHEAMHFKTLKRVKISCHYLWPHGPFYFRFNRAPMTTYYNPNDWKKIAKAYLSLGDYLLWKEMLLICIQIRVLTQPAQCSTIPLRGMGQAERGPCALALGRLIQGLRPFVCPTQFRPQEPYQPKL